MSIRRWNVLGFFVCLLVSVPVGQARQQSSTSAVIAGTVVDNSGGVIPGATVALEQDGKILTNKVSDALGKFRFEGIAAGAYRVRASLQGFKTPPRLAAISSSSGNRAARTAPSSTHRLSPIHFI